MVGVAVRAGWRQARHRDFGCKDRGAGAARGLARGGAGAGGMLQESNELSEGRVPFAAGAALAHWSWWFNPLASGPPELVQRVAQGDSDELGQGCQEQLADELKRIDGKLLGARKDRFGQCSWEAPGTEGRDAASISPELAHAAASLVFDRRG